MTAPPEPSVFELRLGAAPVLGSPGPMNIRCPTCGKQLTDVPRDYPPRPFCSQRCKLADLNSWLNEAYRISEPLHSAVSEPQDISEHRELLEAQESESNLRAARLA
jgi:uncharacterized protein